MSPLIPILVVVLIAIFYNKKRTSYTLKVEIKPEEAAQISRIMYTKGRGSVIAEFTVDIKEGYALTAWTGTLPRLEGYDPSRWYDSKTNKVRLEIDKNEKLTLHFEKVKSTP
ncbi:MAG: hypothetical protein GX971_06040 [Firmicutes bacterium]|nr:hypothetical protein [Bacillota bacterium]